MRADPAHVLWDGSDCFVLECVEVGGGGVEEVGVGVVGEEGWALGHAEEEDGAYHLVEEQADGAVAVPDFGGEEVGVVVVVAEGEVGAG